MGAYVPGTVAWVAVDGAPSFKAIKCPGPGWLVAAMPAQGLVADERVSDIRQLVVLDLRETPHAATLVEELRSAARSHGRARSNEFEWLAEQIEKQSPPPRIPEPGRWGVVEAHINGPGGPQATYRWVREGAGWLAIASTQPVRVWDELIDPVLIRDGLAD